MKTLSQTILLTILLLSFTIPAWATSYRATNHSSDADYTSFLQYGNDNQRVSFFTNKFYDGQSVTHDLTGVEGDFSVFVVNTQQRYALDSGAFRKEGNTYHFEDWGDGDFNDFVFTLAPSGNSSEVPEPGTLLFMTTGLIGLYMWKCYK
jgi:hypothetical protein